ncbi:hypothetical protein [Curtobacterium sp. MCBA15_007]|uniref:hypothetical protein n=1 Tax=Curtobacterium sp. MCBA15_007 TaxID=1898735 RepID=UPI001113517B|nr:hypothetical protein [Curtobacterium sp. MCBA15_007]
MHIETPPVTSPDDPSLRGEAILGMITALRSRPLHEVTPEVVAAAAGVDLDAVARTFPSWDGLLLATIDRWNEERTVPLMPLAEQHGTVRFLRAIVADPWLMRFLTATLNIAASPEPGTMEPARGSEQLLATSEELQLQSMVRPEMDLLEAFDRAVTRLREGWSRAYVPPVWELDLVH